MRFLLRVIVFLGTLVGVLALVLAGFVMGTGNFDILQNIGLMSEPASDPISVPAPDSGSLQTAPMTTTVEQEAPADVGTEMIMRFTWRGDDIIHNDIAISETEFAAMLAEAKASDAKVEIVKFSDVRVETADRWRQLLDDAAVRYELIPQE